VTEKSSIASRVRALCLDNLWVDMVSVAILLTIHAVFVVAMPVFDFLGNALPADRRAVYGSAAIVVSLLASFSGVAIGQLSSAKGARADALRAHGAEVLAKNWRSIFRAGMFSALLALVALLLDPSVVTPSAVPVIVRWLFEAGLMFAIVKFFRLSSLFYQVIHLAAKSAGEEEEPKLVAAPTPNPNWHKTAS
jgi:hypothetical protein